MAPNLTASQHDMIRDMIMGKSLKLTKLPMLPAAVPVRSRQSDRTSVALALPERRLME
jgi:hypothetical protein